jgi:dTMP kinase
MQGLFITFEGIDGSGKSTQASLLFNSLLQEGYSALYLREPGGTKISEKIRDLLLDVENKDMTHRAEFLLYAASRAQLVRQKIRPALEQGTVVICDRYVDSSTAYQGIGRSLGVDIIESINSFATDDLIPDLTFIIDVGLETSLQRSLQDGQQPDRIEQEKKEFKLAVIQAYRDLAERHPKRIRLLNGEKPKEHIQQNVWEHVAPRVELMKKKRQHERL